ncbi:MAG: hypothetical protein ACKO85_04060 [Isosphaeraceae bacterium]
MNMIFDGVAALLLVFTFIAISSEGCWGAIIAFFNIAFSAIVAMNFGDKAAGFVAGKAEFLSGFADCLCMGGIFAVTLILLRFATDYLAPGKLKLPPALEAIGKLVFGAASAGLLVGFLIVILQTAPVHKKIGWGMYTPGESNPPFGLGLDEKALKLVETSLNGPFKGATPFNASEWVSKRTAARPYDNTQAEAGATPTEGGTGTDAGGATPGSPNANSPGIPGGTGGAAVGLAPTM